jgi:tRNA G18 (ribose-2'-O)-methylase SpoU
LSDDPLRFFSGLKDRDLRRAGVVVGEGRLVAARVAARLPLLAVLAEPSAAWEAQRLAAGRCPVTVLPSAEIAAIAGYAFHRGLLVAAERPELPPVDPVAFAAFRRVLVLPEPNDPENLGALARTAAALGWDALAFGKGACDPFGRRALRCSMGAVLSLPLFSAGVFEAGAVFSSGGWEVAAAELVPGACRWGILKRGIGCGTVLGWRS